jgi:diguanylate cyclase (GGDEF)-like protein
MRRYRSVLRRRRVQSVDARVPAGPVVEAKRARSQRRSIASVVALSILLGAAGVLLAGLELVDNDLRESLYVSSWWMVVVVAVGFGCAERLDFHIEYRREALTHTLTEVPMALALVFLGVDQAMLARITATLLVLGLISRPSWYKVVFNVGMQLFTMWLGFYVLHTLAGSSPDGGQRLLLGLVATLFLLAVVEAVIVLFAIASFEGDFLGRVRTELQSGAVRYPTAAIIGALTASVAVIWPLMALLFTVPIAAVWGLMRVHGRTSQRLRDLEELHQLSALVGRSLHRDEVAATALAEVQRLLRADRATLVLFDPERGEVSTPAQVGDRFHGLPERRDDPRWAALVHGAAELVPASAVLDTTLDPSTATQSVIVAPVHDDQGVVGVLVVGDRIGVEDSFDESDAVRAGAIADRLGLALRNATLHEQIEHEAWRDQLTGLPNRTLLDRRLDEALTSSSVESVAVLAVGLDRFREVNSTLGHTVGDTVLTELAARLGAMGGSTELVARVSGDEFAVMAHAASASDAMSLARRVQDTVHAPFLIAGLEISVNTSVGVAVGAPGETSASLLLRQADMAMQWAKANHTNVELFRDEIDSSAPERLSMLAELRTALDQNQLEAFFQPKLDLATGTIVGAEALVRWNHPSKGLIAPAEFVQLAENTGLITTLTDQVIRRTVSAIRLLTDLGFRLDISVNLSTIDLLDDTIVERVERILADAGVLPGQLTLEITETSLLADGARTLATVEALNRMGSKLSIDDFGTGFSSLSYLRTLPASELKVDRSFVSNLVLDERDEVIVRSTIDLGHNLGLRVVAEGVEDSGTLDRLRMLGCDAAQGYGISRPLPLDRLLVWLNSCTFPVARTAAADERSSGQDLSRSAGTVRPIRSVR